jgi:bifunctional DNase/RNase
MKKINLKLLGLSYSQSQVGSYVLVLSEVKGDRKLPIIIKVNEAQYIALKMENIETNRPLTQDLIKQFTDALGADVNEIYIHSLVEGLFYSKIIFSNAIDTFEIECSIGDAISLALLYKCPIYASSSVLDIAGIHMGEDGIVTDDQKESNHKERNIKDMVTLESLEKMLEKAIINEEYEIAGQLRDRINQLKEV